MSLVKYAYLFKNILIGDSGVGKSCLLFQFTDKQFDPNFEATIGVEFGTRILPIQDEVIKIQVWDTAGQEAFRAMTRSYFRNVTSILLCFDITNTASFQSLDTWLADVRESSGAQTPIVLVGCKADLEEKREVSAAEAKTYVSDNGLTGYFETSAKTGANVEHAFMAGAHVVYGEIKDGKLDPTNRDALLERGIKVGPTGPHQMIVNQCVEPDGVCFNRGASTCCG